MGNLSVMDGFWSIDFYINIWKSSDSKAQGTLYFLDIYGRQIYSLSFQQRSSSLFQTALNGPIFSPFHFPLFNVETAAECSSHMKTNPWHLQILVLYLR